MALSNTPEPIDTLDTETDSGVPEETVEPGSDCPVCFQGVMKVFRGGLALHCFDCEHHVYLEI